MKQRLKDVWWTVIPWILQTIVWIPAQIILRFFLHFRVEGYERIKHVRGPVIFVSNHTSYWDPIMIPAALPLFSRFFPMMYVARERNYYRRAKHFIGATSFKVWGAQPAHGGLRDYARSLDDHERFLNQGRSLCMFPEGTLPKKEDGLQPFKGGIGYLVCHTKATVIPISITGMFSVTAKDFFSRKRHATLTFGDPLSNNPLCAVNQGVTPNIESYKETTNKLRSSLHDLHVSSFKEKVTFHEHAVSKKRRADFTFLVHPRNLDDVYKKYFFLAYIPAPVVECILTLLPPVVVSSVHGVKNQDTGATIRGTIISCPITAQQMMHNPLLAKKHIVRCAQKSRSLGAQIIGLGALTASFSRGGLDVADQVHNTTVTTGRIYTAKIIVDTMFQAMERLHLAKKSVRVSIVGAVGSIGAACAQICAHTGIAHIHLVDLSDKKDDIKELKQILTRIRHDIIVEDSPDMHSIRESDIIISATNKPDALIQSQHVKKGAIIVDDAQPSDVDRDIICNRRDVLTLEGGVVRAPGIHLPFDLGLKKKDEIYSCLAETILLSVSSSCKGTPIGRIMEVDTSILAQLDVCARQLGFEVGTFQNSEKLYTQEDIEYIKKIIHNT